jgi:hypothetical protein
MIPHTFFTEIFMQRAVKTDQSEFRRAVEDQVATPWPSPTLKTEQIIAPRHLFIAEVAACARFKTPKMLALFVPASPRAPCL